MLRRSSSIASLSLDEHVETASGHISIGTITWPAPAPETICWLRAVAPVSEFLDDFTKAADRAAAGTAGSQATAIDSDRLEVSVSFFDPERAATSPPRPSCASLWSAVSLGGGCCLMTSASCCSSRRPRRARTAPAPGAGAAPRRVSRSRRGPLRSVTIALIVTRYADHLQEPGLPAEGQALHAQACGGAVLHRRLPHRGLPPAPQAAAAHAMVGRQRATLLDGSQPGSER